MAHCRAARRVPSVAWTLTAPPYFRANSCPPTPIARLSSWAPRITASRSVWASRASPSATPLRRNASPRPAIWWTNSGAKPWARGADGRLLPRRRAFHRISSGLPAALVRTAHSYRCRCPCAVPTSAGAIYEGGLPEDDENVRRILGTLGDIAAREHGKLLWVLGVDMAHMGQRYGDRMHRHRGPR